MKGFISGELDKGVNNVFSKSIWDVEAFGD